MPKLKVYISSTFKDLKDYREVLIKFFLSSGSKHFELTKIMEFMHNDGNFEPQLDTCRNEIEIADVYLIILYQTAGSTPEREPQMTYTRHEFEKAIQRKKEKPDFKIFAFIYSGFDEDQCDDKEKYWELRNQFNDYPKSEFADVTEFKVKMLEDFFSITDSNNNYILKRTPDQVICTLNRQLQRNRFVKQIAIHKNDQVLFMHYQSQIDDAALELNFRLSNVELVSNVSNYENQSFIRPNSSALPPGSEESDLVIMIAEKLGLQAIPTTIEELVTAFSEKETGYIFIPFLIQHSVETVGDVQRMRFLNDFFQSFTNASLKKTLAFRKIIIIVNFQREKDAPEIDLDTRTQIYQTMTVFSASNYLENLSKIKLDDIQTWIMEKIDNNYDMAQEYLKKYFSQEESRPMSKALAELRKAEDIIKNITKNNT